MIARRRWVVEVRATDFPKGLWFLLDAKIDRTPKRVFWLRRNAVKRARGFTDFARQHLGRDYYWRVVTVEDWSARADCTF